MASSDEPIDPDRRGLPPGAELPLAFKPPKEMRISYWDLDLKIDQVAPQALLRDLHRPEKTFQPHWDDFVRIEVKLGAPGALDEPQLAMRERHAVDPLSVMDARHEYRESVKAWRDEKRRALTEPYVREQR